MVTTERRRVRSSRPSEALSFLLEQAKEKLGVRALALGTVSGFLVAGAGYDLAHLAQLGADVDAGDKSIKHIATWRLRVGESNLLLTSFGSAMDPDLGAGVRRILAA
jgi:hypothetical protein